MGRRFTHFIVLAEMRTGSNFLEENLNLFPDIHSYGELFNPHFISGPNREDEFDISLKQREKDPFSLIRLIREKDADTIPGFRFFHDHDPRVLAKCLKDTACAKVILTRNPLDRYISHKIAAKTGQWKLTNIKHKRSAKVRFDAGEFTALIEKTQNFQIEILRVLQISGQTAFYINYDDLNTLDVVNGLARYLGSTHEIAALSKTLKKQNPGGHESKLTNYAQMKRMLGEIDFMALSRTPDFEPRRGASVPGYVAGHEVPILFQPIKGGAEGAVCTWIAHHDECAANGLLQGFNQKSLREWRNDHPGFQSLTVLSHPMMRAHRAFCTSILPPDQGAYHDLRHALKKNFGVKIPAKGAGSQGYGPSEHRAAFLAFLKFLKPNLAGQTGLRIDAVWASQTAHLQGLSSVAMPMNILREEQLAAGLEHIERLLGLNPVPVQPEEPGTPFSLAEIYDAELERHCRAAYSRDYMNFGFGSWG